MTVAKVKERHIKDIFGDMLEQIVNYIGGVALKHIAVHSFKYQNRILTNAQNSNRYFQFIIESNPDLEWVKTSNVYTLTLNIDILGFPTKDMTVLKCQSTALQIGSEVMAYIERDYLYKGIMSIYDYDFMALSEYTDDDAAGFRLTLTLAVPNPIDLCTLDQNFDEDNMQVEEKDDIDLNPSTPVEQEDNELKLTPVKLPRNK